MPATAIIADQGENPRVAARLIEDAERYAVMREEVRVMLQRPEWENP